MPLLVMFNAGEVSAQSFEESWDFLRQNDHALAAGQAKMNTQAELSEAADDFNWPRVDLNASYIQLDKPVQLDITQMEPLASLPGGLGSLPGLSGIPTVTDISADNMATASLQAIWPIYTGGKASATQEIVAAQYKGSQAEFKMSTSERFRVLVERYYGFQLAQRFENLQEQVVLSIGKHLYAAQQLEKQGQIARVQTLHIEVALDDAEVAKARAHSQMKMANLALYQLLNNTPESLSSSLFIDVELLPLSTYLETALATYPGLEVLDAKREQSNSAIDLERSAYKPSVFLFGNYQAYEDSTILSGMTPDWLVGVGISMPLMGNTGRSSKLRAAYNVQLEVQSLTLKARADLELLVNHSYEQAQQAQFEYKRLASALTLAEENIRLREKSFKEGLGTSRDLVDATTYMTSIQMRRATAKFEFVQYWAQLCSLSSRLDTFINYSGNLQ